jgi:hypothetical protein
MGTADLFGWLHSKKQLPNTPAANKPLVGFLKPDVLLADLARRVPRYLAEIDQGRLIRPACKRSLSDADSDVISVWDHTRLEAMQYVMAVPGRQFELLSGPARQIEMIDAYLLQRPHENTVIDFTGTTSANFAIAIVAGLNWLTHCAQLAGVPPAQQSGTIRNFRKLVTLAHQWWLAEDAGERCVQMLSRAEQPPLMLYLIWSEYTRLAKQITAAALVGASVDRSAKPVALPADLVARFEAAKDPGDLSALGTG